MTWTAESVVAAVRPHVEGDPRAAGILEAVAPTLARLFNHEIGGPAAAAELQASVPVLQALDGKSIEHQGTALDFRDATIEGDVNIEAAAGRDLFKFNISVAGMTFEVGERTPYWATEEWLVAKLSEVRNQASLVTFAREALGIDPTNRGIDIAHVIARDLMATTFEKVTAFAKAVAIHDCEVALAIADIAWPFCWVPREAAAIIPRIPTRPERQRGFGLNSARAEAADQYLRRAPMARRDYEAVQVPTRNIEGMSGELVTAVTAALSARIACPPEQCDAQLRTLPWIPFVILGGDALDRETLDGLRDRFPTVTFVVLAGPIDQTAFAGLGFQFVDYLVPPIGPGVDEAALLQLDRARQLARCLT